jgi:deazaflavin-dependent oxidoreductase (nitroreductase family)
MPDFDPTEFEDGVIADMRAHGGEVTTGPMAGRPMLVLTSTGARTNQPRRALLNFSRDGDDYVVAGTASGSPTDPAWVSNVRQHSDVTVEAEGRSFPATATIAQADDRDRLWDQHVARLPWFAEYPSQVERTIPMVRLTPSDQR